MHDASDRATTRIHTQLQLQCMGSSHVMITFTPINFTICLKMCGCLAVTSYIMHHSTQLHKHGFSCPPFSPQNPCLLLPHTVPARLSYQNYHQNIAIFDWATSTCSWLCTQTVQEHTGLLQQRQCCRCRQTHADTYQHA
jgi:hypothetical protein